MQSTLRTTALAVLLALGTLPASAGPLSMRASADLSNVHVGDAVTFTVSWDGSIQPGAGRKVGTFSFGFARSTLDSTDLMPTSCTNLWQTAESLDYRIDCRPGSNGFSFVYDFSSVARIVKQLPTGDLFQFSLTFAQAGNFNLDFERVYLSTARYTITSTFDDQIVYETFSPAELSRSFAVTEVSAVPEPASLALVGLAAALALGASRRGARALASLA